MGEQFGRAPENVTPEELRQDFLHLKTDRRFSRSSSTQAICAIKLVWDKSLHHRWPAEVQFVRANPRFKLHVVLAAAEIHRILAAVPALHRRVALMHEAHLQGAVKLARRQFGIMVSPHELGHAHATHCLERGANPQAIQAAMGHKYLETTMGYLHAESLSVQNPLDELLGEPREVAARFA